MTSMQSVPFFQCKKALFGCSPQRGEGSRRCPAELSPEEDGDAGAAAEEPEEEQATGAAPAALSGQKVASEEQIGHGGWQPPRRSSEVAEVRGFRLDDLARAEGEAEAAAIAWRA